MKKSIKRALALVLVIIMIGLVLLTLYFAITGSRYFMASMVSMLILPILIYSYMFIYKLIHKDPDDQAGTFKS